MRVIFFPSTRVQYRFQFWTLTRDKKMFFLWHARNDYCPRIACTPPRRKRRKKYFRKISTPAVVSTLKIGWRSKREENRRVCSGHEQRNITKIFSETAAFRSTYERLSVWRDSSNRTQWPLRLRTWLDDSFDDW